MFEQFESDNLSSLTDILFNQFPFGTCYYRLAEVFRLCPRCEHAVTCLYTKPEICLALSRCFFNEIMCGNKDYLHV